jgi:hypothetical protein
MVLANISPLRRFRGQKGRIALAALAASTAIGQWAPAATDSWTLAGSGNWATASNWSAGVPVANDYVDITDDDAISRIVTYNYAGPAITLDFLTVDNYGAANNTLQMTGNYVLNADDENFGESGSDAEPGYGFMIQSDGTNAISTSGELILGYGTDDLGAYTLTGGVCTSGGETVGGGGTGSFVQSGGLNSIAPGGALELANTSGSKGTYSLSGTATLSVSDIINVGDVGTAAFNISGGTLSASEVFVAPTGAWNQSGGTANIGGTFIQYGASGSQSDGSLNAPTFTINGGTGGATASYSLSGSGSLAADENSGVGGTEIIGLGGNGLFVQSGGTNTAQNDLYVADGGNGTYSLTGTGSLSATDAYIGYSDPGTFTQSGGSATVSGDIDIGYQSGATGLYQITAGTLDVDGNVNIGGSDSGSGGSGEFAMAGGQFTVGGTLRIWTGSENGLYITGGNTTAANTVNDELIFQNAGTSSLGAVSGTGQIDLGNQSGATVPMTVTALIQNSVFIEPTGHLTMMGGASNNTLNQLTIDGSGEFDITNGHLLIDYGSSSDPISTIAGYIKSGFNGGSWNGPGIISSAAQTTTNGLRYGIGWADGADGVVTGLSSGQIELKYTLLGDANLDGIVNGSDFSILAANFGLGATNWDQGNFLYGSSVNGSDFSALAANFGQGDSGADVQVTQADIAALDSFAIANNLPLPAIAAVPEPATGGLFVLAGFGCLTRQRKR